MQEKHRETWRALCCFGFFVDVLLTLGLLQHPLPGLPGLPRSSNTRLVKLLSTNLTDSQIGAEERKKQLRWTPSKPCRLVSTLRHCLLPVNVIIGEFQHGLEGLACQVHQFSGNWKLNCFWNTKILPCFAIGYHAVSKCTSHKISSSPNIRAVSNTNGEKLRWAHRKRGRIQCAAQWIAGSAVEVSMDFHAAPESLDSDILPTQSDSTTQSFND